jgi:uncharacterized protein YkwD
MMRSFMLSAIALLCLATDSHAQCGLFGRIFRPRQAAYASACYSSAANSSACYSAPVQASACYSTTYTVPVYAAPQSVQPAPQAPSKAIPALPAKSTPQTSDAGPLPPAAEDMPPALASAPMPPPAEDRPLPPAAESEPTPVAQPAVVQVVIETDPYGFAAHLNGYRAQYGLRPLRFSRNLAAWAHQNSLRGFGHTVRFGRRQNSAWGQANAAVVASDWMQSSGHRDAMLDPNVTEYGIAVANAVWTLNLD